MLQLSSIVLFISQMNEMISDRPMSNQIMGASKMVPSPEETQRQAFMDIRINADDQSSCRTACYWGFILAAILTAALLSGLALPNQILQTSETTSLVGTNLANCSSNFISSGSSILCGSSGGTQRMGQYVNNLGRMNQFLVFYLYINSDSLPTTTQQLVNFKLYRAKQVANANGEVSLELGELVQSSDISLDEERSRRYKYLGFINNLVEEDHFYWEVTSEPAYRLLFQNYQLQSFVVNSQYSAFCIAIRLAFMAAAIAFCWVYSGRYRKIRGNRCLPEQKIVLFLSLITITFNDPFYSLTILHPNNFTTFISTFFTWNFITTVFVIWGFFLQRIKEEPGIVTTKLATKGNIIAVVSFYLINMTYRVSLALFMASDRPFTDPAYVDNFFISVMYNISSIAFLAVMIYILMLYCQLWSQESLLWRHTLFKNLSLFFYLIVFVIFFSDGFDVFEYSAGMVMFTYTFTNIFSFYMQFMYMPSNMVPSIEGEQQQEEKDEIMANFSIGDEDDVTVDLEKDYDVFVEYQGGSKMNYNGNKSSYLGEILKHSVLEQNDEIKASRLSQKSANSSQIQEKSIQSSKEDKERSIEVEQYLYNRKGSSNIEQDLPKQEASQFEQL